MKRIAIFCDGTWNSANDGTSTNVLLLCNALAGRDADDQEQHSIYVPGVGAGDDLKGADKFFDRWVGGATGEGLDANILRAYGDLATVYKPDDRIYIFGFSRGAYTARSLVGLIRSAGIPPTSDLKVLKKAMARYRIRGDPCTRPANPASYPWRAEFAPFTATSAEELSWRRREGKGSAEAIRLRIAYLGIWDTVGALGVPGYWTTAPLFNERYLFHDAELSSMVLAARHAVAVDERRQAFEPTLWTNVDELNRNALGLAPGDILDEVCREKLPYRQEWFPGDHGAVGGGERLGISAYPRIWVGEGAQRAGLVFKDETMATWHAHRDITERLVHHASWFSLSRVTRIHSEDRKGPCLPQEVAPAVLERMGADTTYHPKALDRVWTGLKALEVPNGTCGVCTDAATCQANRLVAFT